MTEVSEGKKGRVICAWCKGDMGEAETELDTHGCCLKCLKLALWGVDERLSAFGQGQAVKEFARARERWGVVELAEFWQEAVLETGVGRLDLKRAIGLVTEPKFEKVLDLPLDRLRVDWRWYVSDILRERWEELAMETRLGILVMALHWIDWRALT